MNHTADPGGQADEPEPPLEKARRRDTARRRLQVHNAIATQTAEGAPITVSSIARAARVHRSFIHRHADLHAAVLAASAVPAELASSNSAVSMASLRADLLNTRAQNTRLQQHIGVLERRLSQSLGEAVFRESGLEVPDDIRSLQEAITDREQQILELRRLLEEHGDELAAARAANRELMTQLNTRA
jgi:hypothetical protein